MKAFVRGNKIVLSKNEEFKEMEQMIWQISKDFERLKSVCEDRNAAAFPVEVVKRIAEKALLLKEMGKDVEVPESYIQTVMSEKDVLGYFEKAVRKAESDEARYKRKIECLQEFADMLEETSVSDSSDQPSEM